MTDKRSGETVWVSSPNDGQTPVVITSVPAPRGFRRHGWLMIVGPMWVMAIVVSLSIALPFDSFDGWSVTLLSMLPIFLVAFATRAIHFFWYRILFRQLRPQPRPE
ncbi:hypothetical protein J2S41_004400 [Catenuloplanes atrovinosus]|uniref:Uncharacterized protein n=1 Tax=Catenuloplanes atrovinosus TaxID=137266 RepID=A0AAE3YS47_9ACTN|nr:hypothetical protein [Catenuloplanes atrovinosus]